VNGSGATGERPPERRTVFDGRLISVEVVEGRYREIVHHPGACAAVALHGDDVLLVRQLRDAVGERLLEVPAGVRDVGGEAPADCAAREILEETGHRVTHIEPLGRIYTSPGFTDEAIELFLARVEPNPAGPAESEIELARMSLSDAVAAVHDGRITDAKSAIAILLAAARSV
jgi:ADP-ribose pyrophosphatase